MGVVPADCQATAAARPLLLCRGALPVPQPEAEPAAGQRWAICILAGTLMGLAWLFRVRGERPGRARLAQKGGKKHAERGSVNRNGRSRKRLSNTGAQGKGSQKRPSPVSYKSTAS